MTMGTGSVVMPTSGRFPCEPAASACLAPTPGADHKRAAMNSRRPLPLLAALAVAIAPFAALAASTGEAITDCVDLGSDQEIVRAGGGQQFFLRNGDDHYRVSFQRTCDSITMTSRVEISTEGQPNRLCAAGTRVKTTRDTCRVGAVEAVTAEEFATRKKRASR